MKFQKTYISTAIALALLGTTACGGGGSSGSSSSSNTSDTTSKSATLNLQAIDGYLFNATVCIDLNNNGLCDNEDIVSSEKTNVKGEIKLIVEGDKLEQFNKNTSTKVLVVAKKGETYNVALDGSKKLLEKDINLSRTVFPKDFESNDGKVRNITPYTTLADKTATEFKSEDDYKKQALDPIATSLGTSLDAIESDFNDSEKAKQNKDVISALLASELLVAEDKLDQSFENVESLETFLTTDKEIQEIKTTTESKSEELANNKDLTVEEISQGIEETVEEATKDNNQGGSTGGDDNNQGGSTGGDDNNQGGDTGGDDNNQGGDTGGDDNNQGGDTGGDDNNQGGDAGGDDSQPDENTITYSVSSVAGGFGNKLHCYTTEDVKCDLRIYQVMVESFQTGNTSLQHYETGYGSSNHKGDIKGITNALDYIKGLGMNAIWLTPVFDSSVVPVVDKKLDATGYFTGNYFKVDPYFGTDDDLKELVDKAHEKGMYVFLDGVFGHFKDVSTMQSKNGKFVKKTKTCNNMGGTYIAGNGQACPDWSDEGTNEYFKEFARHYITDFKIDGWRLDQAYQLDNEKWKMIREVVEDASSTTTYTMNGETVHPLGYMVAEIWGGEDDINKYGFGTEDSPVLESVFDFPLRYKIVQTLASEEWLKSVHTGKNLLEGFQNSDSKYPTHAMPNSFVSNHDVVRFGDLVQRALAEGKITNELYNKRVLGALSLLAIPSGPITSYYGEEVGQEVPNYAKKVTTNCADKGLCDDHVSRDQGRIDGFTENENLIKSYFTSYMKLRANSKALSNGKLESLLTNDDLFSIRKTKGDSVVYYFLNVNESKRLRITLDSTIVGDGVKQLVDPIICTTIDLSGNSYRINLDTLAHKFLVPAGSAEAKVNCEK